MVRDNRWRSVDESLQQAVNEGVFPGAVVLAGKEEKVEHVSCSGHLSRDAKTPVTYDTVYDAASLTKPVCTVALLMSLISKKEISVNDTLGKFFSEKQINGHTKDVTIEDVLSHQSGIRSYVPFYEEIFDWDKQKIGSGSSRQRIFERARSEEPEYDKGAKYAYSDLGFIILCEIIERVGGSRLDKLAKNIIFDPIGMTKSSFVPWKETNADEIFKQAILAPTQYYDWLGAVARGVVHDENCYCMGGISGHAGLFTTVRDLAAFARELLKGLDGRSDLFDAELCKKFFKKRGSVEGSPWALGWKTPSIQDRSCGDLFGKNSIGHLGFTGCSIWIDLDCRLFVILLSNRVNLGRDNIKIREFRPTIHNKVMKILKGML